MKLNNAIPGLKKKKLINTWNYCVTISKYLYTKCESIANHHQTTTAFTPFLQDFVLYSPLIRQDFIWQICICCQ